MAEASKATLRLDGDASGLRRSLKRARSATAKIGRRIGRIATRIGQVVTAALAAAGGAAIKFAADFEKSTTRLQTLVGLTGERVGAIREEILQLAPAVGKSARSLSEAMFTITSAGLRGEKAMNLLRQTAKASVVGLGNMRQIANAATSAMNAFGAETLSAREAVDQMLVTVRKGKLPPEQLAGALSKVVGMAAQVGVSFSEVNSFIATFTRLGAEARVAATSLRQVLANIIKPSKQTRETFRRIGSSIDEFRAKVGEKGLTRALIDLIQAQKGNLDVIGKLIPDVRALAGVLSTAGSQAATFADIQRSMRNAVGATDEAFRVANRTLSQLGSRMLRSVEVGLIRIAREFFPELKSLARFLRQNMGKAFAAAIRGLRDFVRAAIVAGARFAESPLGQLMGMDAGRKGEIIAEIDRKRDALRRLLDELRQAKNQPGPFRGGAGRTGIGPVKRDVDEIAGDIRQVQADLTRLNQDVFDIPTLGRLTGLADRLEGIGSSASAAAADVKSFRRELEKISPKAPGTGISLPTGVPRPAGLSPHELRQKGGPPGLGTEGFSPGALDLLSGNFGLSPEQMKEFGERSGESMIDGMESALKRGARSAMESLLRGLIEGRDNILDAVVNIGISIASSLATQGIMKELDIGSPSGVAREIGMDVGRGLILGVQQMQRRTALAGQALAASAVGGMTATATTGAGASVGRRAKTRARGGDTFNAKTEVTINAVDAKSVKRLVRENEGIFAEPAIKAMNQSVTARQVAFGG